MAGKKSYSIHLIVILLAISVPMLRPIYLKWKLKDEYTDKPNLTGLVITDEKPKFSWSSWFDGGYQEVTDDYNADHWTFKEIMVRLNNQMYYELFNQIRVKGFVIGKDDYLFSEEYIYSAFGDDKVDEQKVISLMQKAKVVQDSLKRKGIDLMFVYAPGKGSFCREFVEDKYVHPVKRTNHELFVKYGKQYGINQLDLYTYFNTLKPTAKYPLFPKFGHHWSYYGEVLAVDTIIGYIENLHKCDIPNLIYRNIEVVDSSRSRDADVLKSMNLYRDPSQNMKLAYPEVGFESYANKDSISVLTISDSYWYGPVYMGVNKGSFGNGQFWYYYNRVVPSPIPGEKVEVWQLDLKQSLESNGVIMVLYSDGNLSGFGNNFIPDAYELYTSPKTFYERKQRDGMIQNYAKQIRETPLLLKKSTQRSTNEQIPLDSAIKYDAMKMAGLK